MQVEQLLWQRPGLSQNSSKVLVGGLLRPLRDIFAKILSCCMHSSCHVHPIMTRTPPNYKASFFPPQYLLLTQNCIPMDPPYYCTSHSSPLHILISFHGHL